MSKDTWLRSNVGVRVCKESFSYKQQVAAFHTILGVIGKEDDSGAWIENVNTSAKEKVSAWTAIYDRMEGRPVQAIVSTELKSPPVDDEQLKKIRECILTPFGPEQNPESDE